jgi:hypothetical protein
MDGTGLEDEGSRPQDSLKSDDGGDGRQRRIVIERGRVWFARPYRPDAALPPGADVAEAGAEDERAEAQNGHWPRPMRRAHARPREVEVRDLKAERAGRVFPCLHEGARYTGCVGYDACNVLCWSPRPRERAALVRVEKPTGGPCRDCVYAREVRGEVATVNGRQVRLMECRLGYWHGRTMVSDFAVGKIALNVRLPCPGYTMTDMPHPAVARLREAARRRKMGTLGQEEEEEEEEEGGAEGGRAQGRT